MKIHWTRRYLIELQAIGDYIAERNPRAAGRVVNEIHSKTATLLSANPFIGRPGEIVGTRELVVSGTPYVVAYRVNDDRVEVLFVQHGARLWPDEV
ncbi:type II toxin-antitoxin system RelE/ParE family toxin [Aliirhizobium terrae]|uniref:type II toxin-antitoxin system RelE/ParE family toxin n=1 Tax=Terrirhizobium terrae TaxID=2926709 RepID=UPI0025776D5A|nr:type II toxin-antitoxin system RelE/ParE family toxin [Rhizobium sp. CC-CFT758]WJH40914.1 type II toxin-antitoxin system RelE/ParE family toxin [Rhizobium sp. CC-CFT758]